MGCANITNKVRRAVQASSTCVLLGIASRNLTKAEKWVSSALTEGFEGPLKAHMGYESLLSDDSIGAVYIPLPCGLHHEWVLKAAAAGKGVICEKPAARNVRELKEMIAACERASVPFLDGTMFHFHSRMESMAAEWKRPEFGSVGRVSSSFSFRGDDAFFAENIRMDPALEPFGCLGDLGQYCIRFGLEIYGWELPATVQAIAIERNARGVPIDTQCTFVWASGGPGDGPRSLIMSNSFKHAFHQSVDVYGTNARLHCDDFVISASHALCDFTTTTDPNLDALHSGVVGNEKRHSVEGCNQEREMWNAFGECVAKKEFVAAWANRSLVVQACLDAAATSMLNGGALVPVTLL